MYAFCQCAQLSPLSKYQSSISIDTSSVTTKEEIVLSRKSKHNVILNLKLHVSALDPQEITFYHVTEISLIPTTHPPNRDLDHIRNRSGQQQKIDDWPFIDMDIARKSALSCAFLVWTKVCPGCHSSQQKIPKWSLFVSVDVLSFPRALVDVNLIKLVFPRS